jgi:ornithine--oxo-acid transaminase
MSDSQGSRYAIELYRQLDAIITRGNGAWLFGPEGKRYLDFLACFSAMNHGHCHPAILEAKHRQEGKVSFISQFLRSPLRDELFDLLCPLLGYPDDGKVIMMNTGAEIIETIIKAMRHYSTRVLGRPENSCLIATCSGNFHGRTPGALAASTDPDVQAQFGPFLEGFVHVPFNDLQALEETFQKYKVTAFLFEPIQGESGVVIPDDDYLPGVRALCDQYGVVMIADEIQSGLGRAGEILACNLWGVQPDLVALGKSLGGGVHPVSAVVGHSKFLEVFRPGEHGSTFATSPVACVVAKTSLEVLIYEELCAKSQKQGHLLRHLLRNFPEPASQLVTAIRGKGLMCAMDLDIRKVNIWEFVNRLAERGVITKPTHELTVRLSPTLVIDEGEIRMAVAAILATLQSFL